MDPSRRLDTLAHHTWRSEDGLLQDTVSALVESKDGFLWIGTEAGLVRFDGATFDHYSRLNLPLFEHNAIHCLAEAADGGLWIGTSEPGLYLLKKGEIQVFGESAGLTDRPIQSLLRDRKGTLWAAPVEGPLLRFNGKAFQPVPSDAAQLRIRALIEDADGTIWVGTAGSGIWRIKEGRLIVAALSATEVTSLSAFEEGAVLVGTRSQGLLMLSEGRLEAPAWARALPRKPISSLLLDREGCLWIGVEQMGLYRRDRDGRVEAAPRPVEAPWTPLTLMEDGSGALWAGTQERGLQAIYPVPFHTVATAGPVPDEPVRMVCQDSEGTVWCLSGNQTLGRVQRGQVEPAPSPVAALGPISAMWPRSAGGLWLGTRAGELHLLERDHTRKLHGAEAFQSDAIVSIFEDAQQVLWMATQHQGLFKLAPGLPPVRFPTILGVRAMIGGGTNPLYMASHSLGLGILEAGQIRWIGKAGGLGSNGASALHLDGEDRLWVGTADGLRVYQNGAIHSFTDRIGPGFLAIHAIQEDRAGQMWLSTGQGVLKISRTVLLRGLQETTTIPSTLFDHHDGMPSRDTSGGAQPAAWMTREGDLFIPTSRGLSRLDAAYKAPQGPPLRLHFLKAESDETVLPETRPIEVPPGTHRFEIYYAATSLTRSDKVRFRYRLEGWESAWNDVGDRRFSAYSNLPPGSYKFLLQAWRVDEVGPAQERSVEVFVRPYLYQRPLFWAACALALLGFAWWLHRLRLQQLEARSAVLSERNRMAREIHDHLAQGFTGVLLQLEAAEARLSRMQGDPAPVLTRLDHARNLAVSSLQEARRSVMALRPRKPEGTDLLGAMRMLSERLLAGTDIQVEFLVMGAPRPLPGHLEDELLRMAQELLTNALRHGKARWVRVVLQFEGRLVNLAIEDDGKGFDPSAAVSGYGMRSIREGVKQLHGHLDIDSSEGLGSRISITLPIRRWRS